MGKTKDAMFTDQEPPDDFRLDPEYEEETYTAAEAKQEFIALNRGLLFLALSKAQGELTNVEKKHEGYQGRYKFADLGQVLDIIRPVFAKHGLAFTQLIGDATDGRVSVTTMLLHESGQTLETTSSMALHKQAGLSDAQAAGSIITYLRRYQITAMAGIAQEDTDAAIEEKPKRVRKPATSENFQKPTPNPDVIRDLLACENLETLKEKWDKLDKSEHRLYEGIKEQRKEELQKLSTVDQDIPQ